MAVILGTMAMREREKERNESGEWGEWKGGGRKRRISEMNRRISEMNRRDEWKR
jgi:hypothetical protein